MTKYRTIVVDPPWDYPGMSAPWRTSVAAHYPLLPLDAICSLPVPTLADSGCHLYLWSVLPMVKQAYRVVDAWGFRPSTVVTWCKAGPGLGGGWRGNTEHLIVARKGNLPFQSTAAGTWYQAKRGRHSQKPELFLDLIEQMSPAPRIELFARRNRFGWDTWGNEAFEHVDLGGGLDMKTHCKNGHEFTEENTYHHPNGSRKCRQCARDRAARKAETSAIIEPAKEEQPSQVSA